MHWLIADAAAEDVAGLASALHIGPLAARVLWNRGYRDAARAERFLRPSVDDLHDPHLLRDMSLAVERLRRAVLTREKILLYGDYDVDGTTSVVILKKAIDLAGGAASFHVPHRIRDGYGMRADVIEQAARDGVSLIISVDTGIRAAAVVERANELGIDAIITDHHLPEAQLPRAVAVLNPNRPDCGYPDKNLCGVGVAFKLVQALFATMDWKPDKVQRMLDSFLKLVAIGTVADVVPLTGENRIIVKRGLSGFRNIRNAGLRALLSVSGFADGDCPSAGQVAFRLAPRINAAGRMANANDVVELFLTEDDVRAKDLAGQLQVLNTERQQAERTIVEECSKAEVTDADRALVFCVEGWHRGVVGIVASRLVERFHRPVFVLSDDPEKGEAQGSGRSIPAFHLLNALESMSDLFLRFGGHRQAAGLTLRSGRVEEFRRRLNEYASGELTPGDFEPHMELDGTVDFREVSEQSISEVLSLAPFGFGNPAPVFASLNAEVAYEPTVFKEKHLRLRLRQNGRLITAKAWNYADRLDELRPGARIDAALCFEEDSYYGWSATLKDMRPATGRS